MRFQFTIRGLMWLMVVLGFLCSFRYEYWPDYCERRAGIRVFHPILHIGCQTTWAGPGFRNSYGPDFGVYYPNISGNEHFAQIYWDWHFGGLFTFRFDNWEVNVPKPLYSDN